MKKLNILILFLIQSLFVLGQSRVLTDDNFNNSGVHKLMFATTKEDAIEIAKNDIKKGIPFILLQSGIAPVVYTTDSIFESKFKAYYYEYGCVGPDDKLMKVYNFVIFDFLAEAYGIKWRREIRKDAIGLRQWKRK